LGWSLLIAASFVAWLPAVAHPIASWFLPQGVTLDRAANLIVWGSLATAMVLFSPAAIALGCIGPLAVECVQQTRGGHAGTAGGAVLCASTLGSLAGTFGTTHYLVPALGISWTFHFAGGALALLGLMTLWMHGRGLLGGGSAAALLAAAALLGPEYLPPQSPPGSVLLESRESPYQSVRVVERRDDGSLSRQLQVNEGFDSFQSVWQPQPGLLPPGHYYNYFSLPPWWSEAQAEWHVMVLGLGAGTALRVLQGASPQGLALHVQGVEIDPTVVELARRWMDLPEAGPRWRVWDGWDARAALAQSGDAFDQIVLDTYANQMEIPAHLCSREFFGEVIARLAPRGWLVINIGGFGTEDPVVRAVAGTAAAAFHREALVVRVPFSRNCVAFLRRDAEVPRPGSEDWPIAAGGEVAALLFPLELEGAWDLIRPAAEALVLTDDRNPIDRLQRESIGRAAQALRELGSSR
jgi:spermidine synthase